MTSAASTRRPFYPTPAWLIYGLLVVEGLLWLSERYQWFWFNEKKGWTVLIGVAAVGGAMLVMLGWFLVSLIFRWWFQFLIRSLLVLTVAVAIPFSWLAVGIQQAKRQKVAVAAVLESGGQVIYDHQFDLPVSPPNAQAPGPAWLHDLLGDDFFSHDIVMVFGGTQVTDKELEHLTGLPKLQRLWLNNTLVTNAGLANLAGLTQLKELRLDHTQITDAGLEHLAGLTQLHWLDLNHTRITDAGLSYLSGLIQLRELWLDHTQITNAGLTHLAGLTQLRLFWLTPSKCTDEGIKKLRQGLPDCQIF